MGVTRHQFLAALHELLQPKVYLEIGVQYGSSLVLAEKAEVAIGIDPDPLIFAAPQNWLPNQVTFSMTSEQFFSQPFPPLVQGLDFGLIDLAFIDGSHLVEDVMLDFSHVQRHMRPGGVIVFDDVLPYNQAIATREQPPGDWTGDVWKTVAILNYMYECGYVKHRPLLVDTWPTGTMVMLDVEPSLSLPAKFSSREDMRDWFPLDEPVPDFILDRSTALHPDEILERLS